MRKTVLLEEELKKEIHVEIVDAVKQEEITESLESEVEAEGVKTKKENKKLTQKKLIKSDI